MIKILLTLRFGFQGWIWALIASVLDLFILFTFNDIKRIKTELKCIKLLQTASPLCFDDNFYHEGNISKMPDFMCFFF